MIQIKTEKATEPFVFFAIIFFLTTMAAPSSYSGVRLGITCIWVVYAIVSSKKIYASKELGLIFAVYVGYNVVSSIYGIVVSAPGALPLSRVYIVWPILFYVISLQFNSSDRITKTINILLIVEFLICFADVWYCFSILGYLPAYPSFLQAIDMGFNFNPYMVPMRFSNQHICTHIFMVPFTIAVVVERYFQKSLSWKLIVLLGFELTATFLTGRIGLWVSVILSVALLCVVRLITDRGTVKEASKVLRGAILLLVFFIVALYVVQAHYDVVSNVIAAVRRKIVNSFTINNSIDTVRKIQTDSLLLGWKDHWLFGNGLGSYTTRCIRDYVARWAYEMTYHYILFSQGLIGLIIFVLFVGGILLTLWKGYRSTKLTYYESIPFVMGLSAILIATYVEPYLFKLGTMWMIFVPFGVGLYAERIKKEGNS